MKDDDDGHEPVPGSLPPLTRAATPSPGRIIAMQAALCLLARCSTTGHWLPSQLDDRSSSAVRTGRRETTVGAEMAEWIEMERKHVSWPVTPTESSITHVDTSSSIALLVASWVPAIGLGLAKGKTLLCGPQAHHQSTCSSSSYPLTHLGIGRMEPLAPFTPEKRTKKRSREREVQKRSEVK